MAVFNLCRGTSGSRRRSTKAFVVESGERHFGVLNLGIPKFRCFLSFRFYLKSKVSFERKS
jgi:hypothetical protein